VLLALAELELEAEPPPPPDPFARDNAAIISLEERRRGR